MKKVTRILIVLVFTMILMGAGKSKSKFYDFSDQLIDGKINKPTTLYTDARSKVKFDRLLRLKKSFLSSLFETSKEKVFK